MRTKGFSIRDFAWNALIPAVKNAAVIFWQMNKIYVINKNGTIHASSTEIVKFHHTNSGLFIEMMLNAKIFLGHQEHILHQLLEELVQ